MKRNKVVQLPFWLILVTICSCKKAAIREDGYVAFSLRVVQQLMKDNDHRLDSAVYNIGGITRIVGVVIDRHNNDIILIGKKSSQAPAARFDDFVTALRARFIYDELPMVSIDPTPTSLITGKQEVRFGGHIEGSSFGKDFLESDILLKKYSLELSQQLPNVTSFKKLFGDDEFKKARAQGLNPVGLKWVTDDSSDNKTEGERQNNTQSRFWYNYKEPYTVRIRGNVFCLMSLDIVIEDEKRVNGILQNRDSAVYDTSSPAIQFSNLFTDNFYTLSDTHPIIKRLKLLFDMTAIAEGLKNTTDIPDIDFLLRSYKVKEINTPKDFDLIKMYAVMTLADGKKKLIHLSGGVQTSIDLQWLNAGDVSYLEKFVLQSRPSKNSLFWRIPVDNWQMPNSNGMEVNKHVETTGKANGCSIYSYEEIANKYKNAGGNNVLPSQGLIQAADAIPTKGVQMKMKIDTSSFKLVDSLLNVRDRILN